MAKKKHQAPHEEHEGEPWLLPYSDLMTLLLALFIALFAISQTDQTKLKQMAQAFTAAFNSGGPSFFDAMGPNPGRRAEMPSNEDAGNSAYIQENQSLEEVQRQMEEYIEANNLKDKLTTELSEDGLMIRIKERALFPSGSAQLVAESQKIAPVIAGLLATLPERVVISGHTDNVPINTAQFPSNWELSSSRALNFMKYIIAQDARLNPRRFSAVGYSEYRPIASNDTDDGRQQNRRVEVFIARNYRFNPNEGVTAAGGGDGGPNAKATGNIPSTGGSSAIGATGDSKVGSTDDSSATGATGGPTMGGRAYTGDLPPALAN